jgi:hypothetical protein
MQSETRRTRATTVFKLEDDYGPLLQADEVEKLKRVEKLVCRAHDEYDLPTEPEMFYVFEGGREPLDECQAVISPYGCGIYDYYRGKDGNPYWTVTERPDGFVMVVREDWKNAAVKDVYNTVRHEIAHAVNFLVDGYTTEKRGNHKGVMDKLNVRYSR